MIFGVFLIHGFKIKTVTPMDHTSTVLHEDQDFVTTAFQLSHARVHVLDNVLVLSQLFLATKVKS